MNLKTVLYVLLFCYSSAMMPMSHDSLMIPLNPKVTIIPSLTKSTSLRLFGLTLGTVGSALLYQSFSAQTAEHTSQVHIPEAAAGVICTLVSFIILYTTQDK